MTIASSINPESQLTDEQSRIVSSAIEKGIFVRKKRYIWRGSMQWFEDVAGIGRRHRRRYRMPEFVTSMGISKEIEQCFEDYTYRTYFGTFVPEGSVSPFLAQIIDIRRRLTEFVEMLERDRERIERYLREHSYDYARMVWTNRYKNEGEPTLSFAAEVADWHAKSFPSGDDLRKRFKLDVLPCNPVCDPGSKYEAAFGDYVNGSIKVSLHNSIIYKRLLMFRTFMKMLDTVQKVSEKGSKARMKKVIQALMFKTRSVIRQNFYGDAAVGNAASALLDTLMVSEGGNVDEIRKMIAVLLNAYYDDNIYLIRHFL